MFSRFYADVPELSGAFFKAGGAVRHLAVSSQFNISSAVLVATSGWMVTLVSLFSGSFAHVAVIFFSFQLFNIK